MVAAEKPSKTSIPDTSWRIIEVERTLRNKNLGLDMKTMALSVTLYDEGSKKKEGLCPMTFFDSNDFLRKCLPPPTTGTRSKGT